MNRARLVAVIAAAILVVGLSAMPVQAAGNKVRIVNYKFKPANRMVSVGTKVVWTNTTAATLHSVTAYGGNWSKATNLAHGQKTHFTFNTPGTYTYYCHYHAKIVGGVCKPNAGAGNMCASISVT